MFTECIFLSIFHVILCTGLMQSLTALDSQVIRGHPCVKRNKQIYCPLPGSTETNLPSLHPTSRISSGMSQGPAMYYHRFNATKSKMNEVYYTKQYGHFNGQNAFDLSDEDEHMFMQQGDIEEHVIEHGNQKRILKRSNINMFIDENKALVRRMFGDAHPDADMMHPDSHHQQLSSFLHSGADRKSRPRRSIKHSLTSKKKRDVCDSTVEIVTPYWASNSEGKIRAIVNSQHLQQAIQQEVCKAVQTKRCNNDCTCEQKYKWHRLLAYDPDMECKGIFMDWFLFPSSCQCMCDD